MRTVKLYRVVISKNGRPTSSIPDNSAVTLEHCLRVREMFDRYSNGSESKIEFVCEMQDYRTNQQRGQAAKQQRTFDAEQSRWLASKPRPGVRRPFVAEASAKPRQYAIAAKGGAR